MENLAIKVIMQILGGGIRRVHHLTSGSSVGDFPGCHMQGRQTTGGCSCCRPVKTYKLTSPNFNLAGGPEFESCYPQLWRITQQTYSQSSCAQSTLVIVSVH